MTNFYIAIDPSALGNKTSGTGVAYASQTGNLFTIKTNVIYGKDYNNQTQYNQALLDFLTTLPHPTKTVIEEYQNYGREAHRFSNNPVSEMIGTLRQFSEECRTPVVMRGASQIKGMTPMVLENQGLLKGGNIPSKIIWEKGKLKGKCWNQEKLVKHEFDAYRHLLLLIKKECRENGELKN